MLTVLLLVLCVIFNHIHAVDPPKTCQYVSIKNDSINGTDHYKVPNYCMLNWKATIYTYNFTNWIYECNASNNAYFIQRIYNSGGNNLCKEKGQHVTGKYFYRKDGYDFNCGDTLANCSAVAIDNYAGNGKTENYIAGSCFKNLNESASVKYICDASKNRITKITYKTPDCTDASNAVNKSMTPSSEGVWMMEQCKMPS